MLLFSRRTYQNIFLSIASPDGWNGYLQSGEWSLLDWVVDTQLFVTFSIGPKANIYKELEVCFPIVVTYYFVLFLQLIDICTRGGVNCEEVVVSSVITFDRLIAVVDSNKMVFDAASQFFCLLRLKNILKCLAVLVVRLNIKTVSSVKCLFRVTCGKA